jgi:hypothetical protein
VSAFDVKTLGPRVNDKQFQADVIGYQGLLGRLILYNAGASAMVAAP